MGVSESLDHLKQLVQRDFGLDVQLIWQGTSITDCVANQHFLQKDLSIPSNLGAPSVALCIFNWLVFLWHGNWRVYSGTAEITLLAVYRLSVYGTGSISLGTELFVRSGRG